MRAVEVRTPVGQDAIGAVVGQNARWICFMRADFAPQVCVGRQNPLSRLTLFGQVEIFQRVNVSFALRKGKLRHTFTITQDNWLRPIGIV
ncbi:MAG: hypothetical protein DME32_07755 [Verrucomicrobia bacterium]|nr:MAG: hypothetical protein DME32_07755 [Verrucomicrobiota bacterium]